MTVQSELNKNNYTGTGSQTVFPYTYVIYDETHMKVYLDDVLQASGYTVDGVNNPSGGNVTFAAAPADQVRVTLLREVPQNQEADYTPFDRFPAEQHEVALDLAAMGRQQLKEAEGRAITMPPSDPGGIVLPARQGNQLKFLGLDDTSPIPNWFYSSGTSDPGAEATFQPVKATGTQALITLGDRERRRVFPEDFVISSDTPGDYTLAFGRWFSLSESTATGVPLYLSGETVYRVTDELNFRDATRPVVIEGPGRMSALIHGDFADAAKAVIDISFTDNANRIEGHKLQGFSVCGNGVVGDPVAIKALRNSSTLLYNLFVPGDGTTILGAARALFNSALIATQVNNSDFNNLKFYAGYQPKAFPDITNTVRFTIAQGANTLVATEDTFEAAMIGQIVILEDGYGLEKN